MSVAIEESRSMVLYGSSAWSSGQPNTASVLSALKAQIASASRYVGEQAVQLHGGLGLASEYALTPLFLRTTMLSSQWGDEQYHLDQLIHAGGLYTPEA